MPQLELEIRADLKKLRKDIDSVLGKSFDVKVGSSGKTKNFFDGLKKGAFGTGKGGEGGFGSLGKIAGSMGLLLGVAKIIGSQIKKVVNLLREASPALQGTFLLFKQAMLLFFRPFGDALATFFLPMALKMIQLALAFNEYAKTEPQRIGEEVAKVLEKQKGPGFAADINLPASMQPAEFGATSPLGLEDLKRDWDTLKEHITAIPTILTVKWEEFKTKAIVMINDLETRWLVFKDSVNKKVIEPIKEKWKGFKDYMTTVVVPKIKEKWGNFKTFIVETVIPGIETAWTNLKNFVIDFVIAPIKSAFSKIVSVIKNIKSSFGFGGKSEDDFIMRPGQGPISINPNDTLIGFKGAAPNLGGGDVSFGTGSIVLNNTINNEMDVRRLAETLQEELERNIRRSRSFGRAVK